MGDARRNRTRRRLSELGFGAEGLKCRVECVARSAEKHLSWGTLMEVCLAIAKTRFLTSRHIDDAPVSPSAVDDNIWLFPVVKGV